MSINRITRKRLFKDEELFNKLLPYATYDPETQLFWHSDASLWAIYELSPLLMLSMSDVKAFQVSSQIQEMLDSFEPSISLQFSWITTFDVGDVLERSIRDYPTSVLLVGLLRGGFVDSREVLVLIRTLEGLERCALLWQ